MDTELSKVNKLVKRFDRDLIARRSKAGVIQVCQNIRKWHPVEIDGRTVLYPEDVPHLVFSLTENWGSTGEPANWGYVPLYQKLTQISLDRRDDMIREMERENEKALESKERDTKNHFESMAYETRDIFKKTFSDINTASMNNKNDVRRKQDRSIKWR